MIVDTRHLAWNGLRARLDGSLRRRRGGRKLTFAGLEVGFLQFFVCLGELFCFESGIFSSVWKTQ